MIVNGVHTVERKCLCDVLSEMTERESPTGIQIPTGWSERKGLHVDSTCTCTIIDTHKNITIKSQLNFEHVCTRCTHVHVKRL